MHISIENEALKIVDGQEHYQVGGETLSLQSSPEARFGSADGTLYITTEAKIYNYVPSDWRAELYLQGLTKKKNQQRPDVYEQELLDLFDNIYNMQEKKFKSDEITHPNDLNYFLDYLEPVTDIGDYSVNELGQRVISKQQDKIIKLYDEEVPNIIMLDINAPIEERRSDIKRCELEGQSYANVDSAIYKNLAVGTIGYSAQEVAREMLYKNTNYNESISIQSIPIYYLDVNSRITVEDSSSDIHGDYIIKSISLPLDAKNVMGITATKAIDRI